MKKIINLYRMLFWSPEKQARYNGVKIGNKCNIQKVNFGSEPFLVEIGNHVQITNGTQFFTHGAAWVAREEYPEIDYFGKIKVGDNVYFGNNSMILAGVTIGSNVIVAAGSVVTKSVTSGQIVAGNPARIVGKTEHFVEKIKNYNVESKGMNYNEKRKYLLSLSDDRFIKK